MLTCTMVAVLSSYFFNQTIKSLILDNSETIMTLEQNNNKKTS